MKFTYYLKNLFTGFRPYSFTNKHSQEKPKQHSSAPSQQQNPASQSSGGGKKVAQTKKFMSKHRYTHTTRKWNIGNTYKND